MNNHYWKIILIFPLKKGSVNKTNKKKTFNLQQSKIFLAIFFFSGIPYLYNTHSISRRSTSSSIDWTQPYDDWNITSLPRSILPHLIVRDHHHILPPTANVVLGESDDDKLLRRLWEIKVKYYYNPTIRHHATHTFLSFCVKVRCVCDCL